MTRSECSVVAATGGHVDDFVFVGKEGKEVWETARKQLKVQFRWKMWKYDNFTPKTEVFSSRNDFVDELREIQIPSHRRKEMDSPVSQQQTEMRGLVGGLGWKCEQTGPQRSAAAGLQRSRIEHAQKRTSHINLQFPY